jgi:hypothetical protein
MKSNLPTQSLTLILLTWSIGWAPNNASKSQMGFNSAFKGLNLCTKFGFFLGRNTVHLDIYRYHRFGDKCFLHLQGRNVSQEWQRKTFWFSGGGSKSGLWVGQLQTEVRHLPCQSPRYVTNCHDHRCESIIPRIFGSVVTSLMYVMISH